MGSLIIPPAPLWKRGKTTRNCWESPSLKKGDLYQVALIQVIYYFFLWANLNVCQNEGDPPGRPYKSLYYFYESDLVSRAVLGA